MFKLDLSPTFSAAVRFEVPGTTAGVREVHEFTAQFARLDADALQALGDRILAAQLSDRQIAAELMCGWGDDVCDRYGAPLPYTPDNLTKLLAVAGVASAVVAAFRQAQPRAALGN